ncbi:hypothetical protein [Cedecea sp. NFIX57]|uniref:hypothetical protein n=1 Tax=Cedecea sp. NFIX57 TaxID=1566286 RepID=UPI000A0E8736|nr:hypothetical protein [Cedecea sp. NFIX57]SMG61939.1 hypothetical protein SAMN03159353_108010 [Cedecea sp. NFIX57]
MSNKQSEKQSAVSRQARVNKVIDLLQEAYSEEDMHFLGRDLWLVMQVICGPVRATAIVRNEEAV